MNFDNSLFLFTAPIITSAVAFLIILFDMFNGDRYNRWLKSSIALYLGSYVITMSGALLYFYFPLVFMYLNSLILLSFMLLPVFLYAFIFQVTRTHPNEKFSKLHYVIPLLLGLLQLLLTIITPVEDQLLTITGNGSYMGGSRLFHTISNNKMLFRLVFSLIYTTLSFMRLPKYRQFIQNYASNESKSSLRWLKTYLLFIVFLIPIPLAGVFMSRTGLAGSLLAWVHYTMLLIQHSFMAYHLVKQNYVTLFHSSETKLFEQDEIQNTNEINDKILNPIINESQPISQKTKTYQNGLKKNLLNKESFDKYLHHSKPYLNPELKITDLVKKLNINRTYISAFINAEYNMNFSCFINYCRINEFDKRRKNPKYKHLNNEELAETVGFRSYRNYQRVVSQLNISKTII